MYFLFLKFEEWLQDHASKGEIAPNEAASELSIIFRQLCLWQGQSERWKIFHHEFSCTGS